MKQNSDRLRSFDPAPPLRLCLERLIPKATHESINLGIEISETNKPEYLTEIGKKLIFALSDGNIPLKEAQVMSGLLESQRKLIEQCELKRMLDEIDDAIKWKNNL